MNRSQRLKRLSGLLGQLPTLGQLQAEKTRRAIERQRLDLARNGELIKDRCKTLAGFVREAWHVLEPGNPYVHGWHIDAWCAHLEAITSGRFLAMGHDNRLLGNVPPGTMKSLMTSVFWQAWEWGPCGMPHLRYLTTSYKEDYAKRDARKTRDLINSEWYQTLWPIRLKREGESSFENEAGGTREAMPFASLTGGRGDRVIIDDPHSTETVESDAELGRTIRVFRESVPSRINDARSSAIVIIMQRLRNNDVSGVAIDQRLGYIHVMLPMEFEPERRCKTPIFEDPRTQEGELLFPERFPREQVERDKRTMGSHAWSGQAQQRPSPRGGLLFKRHWFEIVKAAPIGVRWVRGWDLAATKAKGQALAAANGPAYTAGLKLGRGHDGMLYIGHVTRAQESAGGVKMLIKNTASQDGRTVEISLPQDPGQAGKAQIQDLIAMLAGFHAYGSPETGDKYDRALPVAAQAEAGNVKLVEGAWNEAFLAEIEAFPAGRYKDQVDALSRAFGHLVRDPIASFVSPILFTAGARAMPG